MLFVLLCKIAYDGMRNEQQKALFIGDEENGPSQTIWEQVGEDSWLEGKRARYYISKHNLLLLEIFVVV
jgi:hypothetical protein